MLKENKMVTKRKVTPRDLAASNPTSATRAAFDRVLKIAYRDQQKLLRKAARAK